MTNSHALLKTLLIPPALAIALYLLISYTLLPLWHRYRERATYTALPAALPSSIVNTLPSTLSPAATSTITKIVTKLSNMMLSATGTVGVRYRRTSEGSLQGFDLGDEELEEGISAVDRAVVGNRGDSMRGDRRLSRDLESGFMDDSDSDSGHERMRR